MQIRTHRIAQADGQLTTQLLALEEVGEEVSKP